MSDELSQVHQLCLCNLFFQKQKSFSPWQIDYREGITVKFNCNFFFQTKSFFPWQIDYREGIKVKFDYAFPSERANVRLVAVEVQVCSKRTHSIVREHIL